MKIYRPFTTKSIEIYTTEMLRKCCDKCHREVIDSVDGDWRNYLGGWRIPCTGENDTRVLCPACVKEEGLSDDV